MKPALTTAQPEAVSIKTRSASLPVSTPSSLYRPEIWRLGLRLARVLPRSACARLGRFCAGLYWMLARRRREVVVQNLLPVLEGNRAAAQQMAQRLFQQFALKVTDLWRYESGLSIDDLFGETTGWEHFVQARSNHGGVLVVTVHLGNWE